MTRLGKIITGINGGKYLGGCLLEGVSTTWFSSLMKDDIALFSMQAVR